MTQRIKSIMVLGLFAALLVALSACGGEKKAKAEADKKKEVVAKTVAMLPVKTESFVSTLQASGKALPVRESMLSSEVSGTVAQILVTEGDRVKKGQVLMRFEQEGFLLGVQQAEAALAAAKAGADQMRLEVDRMSKLVESDATAKANYDRVKAQYDAAQAQLHMAEAGLANARRYLRLSTIAAPYDGSIVMILQQVGENCPAMPPTMLMKIVDSSSLEVQVFLPEAVANAVKPGDDADVEIDNAGLTVKGKVYFVSDRIEAGSQNVEIRLKVDNADGKIKAGSFARVTFVRSTLDAAVLVSLRAVRRDPDGKTYVFLVRDGKAQKVPVVLGENAGDRVLILDGLKAGDPIITTGIDDLEDGTPVTTEAKG